VGVENENDYEKENDGIQCGKLKAWFLLRRGYGGHIGDPALQSGTKKDAR
jgi:hypothetical protein